MKQFRQEFPSLSPRRWAVWIGRPVVLLGIGLLTLMPMAMLPAAVAQPGESITRAEMRGGVGAFGTLQPRSRVITLSHDGGFEGVRIEKVLIEEGDEVKAGQVVVTFSDLVRRMAKLAAAQSKEKVVQSNLGREQSNYRFIQREFQRIESLRNTPAITTAQLDKAKRNLEMARHKVESLRFELAESEVLAALAESEVEQGMLRAPISGTVLEILARPGERAMNEGILKIADLSAFDVVAEVYERDIGKVRVGQKVQVLHPGTEGVYFGTVDQVGYMVKKSRLFYPDPSLDRDERVIEVRARLDKSVALEVRHMINAEVRVRFQ